LRRLPSFLYIGASRSGSSWLFEILREHPEVFVPIGKDMMFFDRYFDRGVDWYASHFAKGSDAKAVGELSHDYFLSRRYAERIRDVVPDVKLIATLREPGDWAISRYLWARSTGLRARVSFEEYVRRPEVLREASYAMNLQPFYELFPRERIRIQFFDDLREDPAAFAREVYAFIGVDQEFTPPSLHRKVYAARQARLEQVGRVAYRAGQAFRSFAFVNLVGGVRRHPAFERLLYRSVVAGFDIPDGALSWVREQFAPGYHALENLIGRPLPQGWRVAS